MHGPKFIPGKSYLPVSGKVFNQAEIKLGIQAVKDGWWTEGRFAKKFEQKLGKFLQVDYVSLVNSGSSANLLALFALTAPELKERQLKPGDEFITTSLAFPTTVNPGVMAGLKPVFMDASLTDFNIDVDKIEAAVTAKTKLIMVAHTLGRPFNLTKIKQLCHQYNLWLIEDCCDALGSKFQGRKLGSFGDLATFSFYPAHQITMGEGGAVVTNNPRLHRYLRQFRDWGRDCWCDPGHDNTCGKRFSWQMGELPKGYDHKYIYSKIGFNLKLTDMQAAIGLAQLEKLPRFIVLRQRNYNYLYNFFVKFPDLFILPVRQEKENLSYFGFPLIVNPKAKFTRNQLTEYLENHKIGTRNIFAGNLLKHPAYLNLKNKRIVGKQNKADLVMNNGFWLGVWPGLKLKHLKYMTQTIENFLTKYD